MNLREKFHCCVQFLSCVAQRLKMKTNFFEDVDYMKVINVVLFNRSLNPAIMYLINFASYLFFRQILQECFSQSGDNVDTVSRPASEASTADSVEYDSSVVYDFHSDVSQIETESLVSDVAETTENEDIDQPASSAMNSDELSDVQPIETTIPLTQKRKLTTENVEDQPKLSAEDEEIQRILKRRVKVVIKRMKFDENMNEWILPEDTVTANEEKANHNKEEIVEQKNESETGAEVITIRLSFE